MTPDDRKALAEAARAATPGTWHQKDGSFAHRVRLCNSVGWEVGVIEQASDAHYIAAAHPQAILALLDELLVLHAAVVDLRGTLASIATPGKLVRLSDLRAAQAALDRTAHLVVEAPVAD